MSRDVCTSLMLVKAKSRSFLAEPHFRVWVAPVVALAMRWYRYCMAMEITPSSLSPATASRFASYRAWCPLVVFQRLVNTCLPGVTGKLEHRAYQMHQ